MIAHIILFRPKATLDAAQRAALATTLVDGVKRLPTVRRVRVGRRMLTGRPYEQRMSEDYTHAVIIEFDDRAARDAYLAHPTHRDLAARFFQAFEVAMFYDYTMSEDASALL